MNARTCKHLQAMIQIGHFLYNTTLFTPCLKVVFFFIFSNFVFAKKEKNKKLKHKINNWQVQTMQLRAKLWIYPDSRVMRISAFDSRKQRSVLAEIQMYGNTIR